MSCASYKRSWTVEQGKETKIRLRKGTTQHQRGQNQLQQNKKACEPKARRSHSTYISDEYYCKRVGLASVDMLSFTVVNRMLLLGLVEKRFCKCNLYTVLGR
jgi:hypothetical protein